MTSSDERFVRYETDGPVVVITIDRPERMNAIGPEVHEQLIAAWTRFRDDDTALCAVQTGSGEHAFCAGGDLKAAFAGELNVPMDAAERAAHERGERPGIQVRRTVWWTERSAARSREAKERRRSW